VELPGQRVCAAFQAPIRVAPRRVSWTQLSCSWSGTKTAAFGKPLPAPPRRRRWSRSAATTLDATRARPHPGHGLAPARRHQHRHRHQKPHRHRPHRLARPGTEATVRDILGATTVVATMLDRSLRRSVVLNLDAGLVRILVAGVVAASGRAWVIGAPGRAVVGVRTRSVRRRLARGPGLRRRFAPVRGSLRPGRARSVRGP
jgi:hypothetical protein